MTGLMGYLMLVLLAVLSGGIVAGALALGRRITPPKPTDEKLETYECGERALGGPNRPIDIKYYIYVLIFLVIDVEVVFLIPWAVEFRRLGELAFIEIMIFVTILLVGWAYAWKEGFLKWHR